MIKITEEMRGLRNKRMAEVEEKVDQRILAAVEAGRNKAYFACDRDVDADVYELVKQKYQDAGYWIIPDGVIGGVMQTTESICW